MKTICDWKNCKEIGSYKAPIERDNSKKFRLLCLEHIKIFNKNWNYFENMNDNEIEFFLIYPQIFYFLGFYQDDTFLQVL